MRRIALAALAVAAACEPSGGDALRLRADPPIAEVGGVVALAVDGADDRISWRAAEGSFADAPEGEPTAAWRAPDGIGVYEIEAAEAGGAAASIRVEVRAFGPRPTPGCTVRCDWIERGSLRPDQVPALDSPPTVPARAATWIPDAALAALVWIGGAARAYPLSVLAYHEVVNDALGGAAITVSYGPRTGAAAAFRTGAAGRFGNLGAFYDGDHLLYNRATRSSWSPLRRECVGGARAGAALDPLPMAIVRFAGVRALAPDADVAWPEPADPVKVDYGRDPYAWYEADDGHLIGRVSAADLRLPRKERVLGLWRGGVARAYPLARLGDRAVIDDDVNGLRAVVVRDAATVPGAAYRPEISGRALRFELAADGEDGALMRDAETGSEWDALGRAIRGPLAGARLEPVPSFQGFFFAWAAYRHGTEIWGQGR